MANGKITNYPIRQLEDNTQLINWVTEQPRDNFGLNDWTTPGRIQDFTTPFQDWHFDWLDIPKLIADAEYNFEYPMVDREPIDRWSYDLVTLMGDAAHPMFPRGGNGGAQAILDAEALARLLDEKNDPVMALRAYEEERRNITSKIVLTNRDQPPDYIIQIVENLTGGEPFDRIEDIIDPTELAAISDRYKDIAGYSLESVELHDPSNNSRQ